MSSLRNAVKRVTHKERSQPRSRSHLGLLEKKSDYKLRSRDYHAKQNRLKSMRTKAANRNPDEFYFGMHNSRIDGLGGKNSGRHVRTEEARRKEMEERGLGPDAVRIMKDQDLAYVRMQRMMDGKKIEKLQSSLHYLEGGGGGVDEEAGETSKLMKMVGKKRKHTVFVEGGPKEAEEFDSARHFDTLPELVGRAFNRPRLSTLERQAAMKMGGKVPAQDAGDDYYDDEDEYDEDGNPKQTKQLTEKQLLKLQREQRKLERGVAKSRSAAYGEMELRNERLKKLENAEAHLVVEKQVRMKGRRRKVEGREDGRPAVFKWRRKRAK